MNNERRKAIKDAIRSITNVVQDILSDEQAAYDNMPDGLRESENGLNSADAQDNLEAAIESLEEAICYLEEIN
jgi:hypothetical protein